MAASCERPSLLSTYRAIPKCQAMRGIINDNPRRTVVHNIGLQFQKSHFWSPKAQIVTTRWKKSPMRSGVIKEKTIFSWRAGLSCKCFRAAVKTEQLMTPMRAQTCASCNVVTRVALGRTLKGSAPAGQGACELCACCGYLIKLREENKLSYTGWIAVGEN